MKELIGHNSELTEFNRVLENWNRDRPLCIHFQGEPGCGKTHLIRFLYQKKLPDFLLLYHLNYNLFQFDINLQLKALFQHLYSEFRLEIESFLKSYPRYLRFAVLELFQTPATSKDQRNFSSQFLNEMLLKMLSFFSGKKQKPLIVLENVNFEVNEQTDLLRTFLINAAFPVLIITSGSDEPPNQFYTNDFKLINVQRLSAIDIQKFVQVYLSINESNARFIANHLQIKSQGMPAKIKYMLEAYYRDITPDDPAQFIDTKKLRQLRISPVHDVIFRDLLEQFSEIQISIFLFLSRLIDPIPLKMLEDVLQKLNAKKHLPISWIEKGYLSGEEFLGENFVLIEWEDWKRFLRRQPESLGNLMENIMNVLDDESIRKRMGFPLQLSHIYFEMGDKKTALRYAHREAILFRSLNLEQRAYERYNFLKRNLTDYPDGGAIHEAVYQEMGELQKSLGLFENAFESFRELRDRIGKDDKRIWFSASLQMAEILLKMDAFAEARYLLNDLKIKKAADTYTKSFAIMLLGDLDKNLARDEYALRKYEKALSLLDNGRQEKRPFRRESHELIFQLYSRIRRIYVTKQKREDIQSLVSRSTRLLRKGSRYHQFVRLDLTRCYIDGKEFERARQLAFQLLHEVKRNFDPSIMAQTVLYLVEIYAYFSKWYLARSHLRELVRLRLFFISPKIRVRMFIHLAVIEKEIGRYGKALSLLAQAEKISKQENYPHEQNEVKIHKGHIQLLIHGYLRQREFLADALQWSVENYDQELFISASLYMSYYELQQGRLKRAKRHLDEARSQISRSGGEIDKLNYVFYLLNYLFRTERYQLAGRIIRIWKRMSLGIAKFENLALWFEAKLFLKRGDLKKSLAAYEICLERSRKYHIPHLEFHILKEMVMLSHQSDLKKELKKFTPQLKSAFRNLLTAIEDEILQKQFCESREVEELAKIAIVLH